MLDRAAWSGCRFRPALNRPNPSHWPNLIDRSFDLTSDSLTIAVARERQTLDARLTDLNIEIGAMGLLLLAAIPLVIARVVPRGLRPLEDLARQATSIDATSLGQRFPIDGLPIELAVITARLNELLDRLAKGFERERRFSADAAHELRTPIAELRTLAEVALHDDRPADADRHLLQDVLDAAMQMQNLVTSLLALARCQSGHQPINMESVDATTALLHAWSGFQPAAVDKQLEVDVHASVAANVRADPALLEVVLSNLLGNATTYVPVAGRIGLSTTPEGDQVTIAIANTTDTIAQDDLPHLFEPFWRKDPARTDGTHSGLGLSLVAAMLSIMGGKVQAVLNPPGWIRFVVTLPGA
jgi:signal transduction histidine kinase